MSPTKTVACVLVHSPLVGASFWRPVARELEARGWRCHTPTATSSTHDVAPWCDWPGRLRDALPSEPDAIWVGHSAAGMLLPACARMLNAGGLVFVDASLPPATGTAAPVDAPFMEFVRGLPLDGDRLPAWSEWWGKDAIATLMPDPNERRQFDLELPRLKLAWFDDAVEVPDWRALRAGYVQTSRRFAHDAATARAHGWPVEVLDGTHLHPLLAPRETAAAIERAVKLAELR